METKACLSKSGQHYLPSRGFQPHSEPETSQPSPSCTDMKPEPTADGGLDSAMIHKPEPEIRTEPTIALEPEPHEMSDQLREPATSCDAVGVLVEYEGMGEGELKLASTHLAPSGSSFPPTLAPPRTLVTAAHGLAGSSSVPRTLLPSASSQSVVPLESSAETPPTLDSAVGHHPGCTLGPRLPTPSPDSSLAPPTFITTLVSPSVISPGFLLSTYFAPYSRVPSFPPQLDFYGARMHFSPMIS